MRSVILMLLGLALTSAAATKPRSQFTRYRSWNQRMYPVWKDGDPRFRNCWNGGEVTFDLKNDAPTLTGARATFSINLNFPPNQTVLPDGQVVWSQNCTINGRQYQEGQAVYPDQDSAQTGVFPDGTPFTGNQNRKNHYVFVWKTWGRYWQVADGPSSSLTIGTDNIALGSYNMEVVIYHCRGKDKFIPLGYASTVFTITDQVPFTISMAQVNDVNQNDQNFIQNRAIAFTVKLHDPSQYLNNADISFSWDFGDTTGTLISRELTVTHTYLSVGTFKPQVVLMASIPNCGNPTAVVPIDASAAPAVVVVPATPAAAPAVPAEGGDAIALDVPAETDANAEGEAVEVVSVAPAEVDAAVAPEEQDAAAAAEADAAAEDADAAAAGEEVAPAADDPANADAADETAVVTDADAENVPVIDAAAASVAPVTEGEEAAAETAVVTVAPAAEVVAEGEADVAAEVAEVDVAADAEADAAADVAAETEVTADAAAGAEVAEAAAAEAEAVEAVAEADVTEAAAAEAEVVEAVAEVDDAEAAVAAEAEVAEAEVAEAEVAEADVAAVDAAAEVVEAEAEVAADNVDNVPTATEATAVEEAAADAVEEAEVQAAENEVAATVAPAAEEAAPVEGEVQAEVEEEPAQVALVLAKRQAPELTADCMVYRYGSLATSVDVVQGIESVEIVEVANVVSQVTELDQNAVDVTISCQGSLPSEVCTVISDADCITPVETICNAATPSPDCQMIIRQFFNDSGVFCLNVSLTNDVSLAVASARVSVTLASGGSPAGTAATVLGVMVLACVVCCIGLMYRRFKQYQPLREDGTHGGSAVTSVPLLLWNLLSRQSPGESRPLLQGRIV